MNLTTGPERKKDKESYWEKRDIYGGTEKENLTVSRKKFIVNGGKQETNISSYRGTLRITNVTFEKSRVLGGITSLKSSAATYQTVGATGGECHTTTKKQHQKKK